ncbi:unnamed protein product [Cyclocybe aegerita]|uniref:Chromatin modification-related protein n=1 Tax=Cyclocybe aegerita TaxID=1973307 RepID=A0A8S0VUZ2_CYCAE|nr:unnamed protein product [Cyclocybe aegerita]
MNAVLPNLEEAANVASEFIYSIDNLPNEVSHILQEIKHRDNRTQELQQEIDKDAAKYIRYARRASSSPMPLTTMNVRGTTPSTSTPSAESPSSRAGSPKAAGAQIAIPDKITASYAEIQELAAEKCALAERLIEIIARTREKLDVDIAKVRLLQGESPEVIAASSVASSLAQKPLVMIGASSVGSHASLGGLGVPGSNPALAISESLRNALGMTPAVEVSGRGAVASGVSSAPSPTPSTGYSNKRRRTATATSIKISPAPSPSRRRSSSPAAVAAPTHTQQRSRLSRQIHPPPDDMDMDADADGDDDDADMEEEVEDERLYCFCQKQSYGDMIACDNEGGCPYEWFHLSCVGLKQPPAEKWFCSVCIKDHGLPPATPTPAPMPATTTTRKGRKK